MPARPVSPTVPPVNHLVRPDAARPGPRRWRWSRRPRAAGGGLVTLLFAGILAALAVPRTSLAQDPRSGLLETFVTALAARGQFNGNILVAARGEVIFERAVGQRSVDPADSLHLGSQFRLASASKPFTALAIIQLKEAGRLSYEDPVEKLIPEWPYRGATVRHLLNHTSGIPDYRDLTDRYWKPESRMDDPARVVPDLGQVIGLFDAHHPEPSAAPGTAFASSDVGYMLLATIIERVSGMQYHQYMRTHVFLPAGMNDTYAVSPLRADPLRDRVYGIRVAFDRPGYMSVDLRYVDALEGSGGIYSTLRDLYAWDRALYTDRIVSQASLREAFAPGVLSDGRTTRYGFGWGLGQRGVSHDGYAAGFGVWIYREIAAENTVIILTTGGLYLWDGVNQGVLRILGGESYELPRLDGVRLVALALLNDGPEAARRVYRDLQENRSAEYALGDAGGLDAVGGLLLQDERRQDALTVRRFNAELYPTAPLVWNSLGDTFLAVNDSTGAIASYRRALMLDATSRHATEMLRRLGR